MSIHFICRGNILRSLVAETYLKSFNLKNLNITSSGTNVNWEDETEKQYFSNTLRLLDRHGIKKYVKDLPEQLTQARADNKDLTICMNQRVIDEAEAIIRLPSDIINWNITDIGEEHRIVEGDKELYLEEIYKEIIEKVDELVKTYELG
jgi:protein-tyrosine-phosphatase